MIAATCCALTCRARRRSAPSAYRPPPPPPLRAHAMALADPTRLTIAAALRSGELSVCDLSWVCERAENLVSHHVRSLRSAGLLTSRRDGKMVMYALTPTGTALLEAAAGADRPAWRRDARALSASTAVVVLVIAVAASLAGASRIVAEPIYLLSMIAGGWPIARAAIGALRRQALDMNVLMGLAAVGTVAIDAYAQGAWVLVLFSVGTSLEAMALHRSSRAVDALRELAPT